MASGSDANPSRTSWSLRLRLFIAGAVILVISLGLVGLALDSAFRAGAVADQRETMSSAFYLVLAATEVSEDGRLEPPEALADPRLTQPQSGLYVHVHGDRDHWTSPSALGMALPELATVPVGEERWLTPTAETPFYALQYGIEWEMGALDGPSSPLPVTVSVLADAAAIDADVSAFRRGLWRSLGAAALLLALAQLALLALALRPLRGIADDVARLEAGEAARLGGDYPRELEPLTRNLNRVLASEKANRERYRNALDSLAHSLKTPLAVMRSALGERPEETPVAVQESIDDMHRLITTRLQRAAGSTRRALVPPVAVGPVVERLLRSLQRVHSQKLIRVSASIDNEARFRGEERDLMELLGNLLDNAFRYGRSAVSVTASRLPGDGGDDALRIVIEDDGPGMTADRREALLQRGVRGDEREDGHGLGLAIVVELVEAYGGTLTLGEGRLGGACVELEFPGDP